MNIMQEKQLKKEAYTLYYYTAGDPKSEAIVFIHPAYGDHTCFHHQVDTFARDYHVICVDMLGHGKSQPIGGNATIESNVADVAEIIAYEGHNQAHLVGVSLGSLVAQAIADQYPQKVATITVTGGYSIFGDNSAITKAQNREIFKAFFLIIFWIDGFRRYVVKNTNIIKAEQEVFYRAMQHFTHRSLPVMAGMQKILTKAPKNLTQPLLIAVGDQDIPIIVENARIWQKSASNAKVQIIPSAGHCANMDNPAEFNRILKSFLATAVSNTLP
jgi:3-oxoadipate enol-lactonase